MPSSEAAGQASLTTWPHRPWEDLMISEHDSVDVFIGIDVGKSDHHAVGIDRAGKKLLDKPLPQDEAKLRALISKVSVHGTVLVVVDQPTSTPGRPRPMPATRPSSLKPLAACPTLCGLSPWPMSRRRS